MREISLQEAEDILYGACILGAGGGGSLEEGLKLVRNIYERGQSIRIVTVDEIKDDWLIVSPYYVGSVAPPSEEVMDKLRGLKELPGNPSVFAAEALQNHLGKDVDAICATELGGNTAWAMDVAATMQLPLVDGDPAGRAVPDLAHTTFNVHGASITPFALASRYGDHIIVESVVNHDRADQIARSFAMVSGNIAGICDHPLDGKRFREYIIPDTLSRAGSIGYARRVGQQNDPIASILKEADARLLTNGVIIDSEWHDANGFIEGTILIKDSQTQETWTIWFRNENMIARKGDELISIIPTIISILDCQNGDPILNPQCQTGMKVAVITFPSPKIWTTKEGLAIFGPTYIGMDNQDYGRTVKK